MTVRREKMSLAFYREIAAKATTLREKIDEPQRFLSTGVNDHQPPQYLAEWRNAIAPDDPFRFVNRLKNDGLTEHEVENLLGPVEFISDEHLPEWIGTFSKIMEFLESYDQADESVTMIRLFGTGKEKEIPYLHLLTPVVACATDNLDQQSGERKTALFSTEAIQQNVIPLPHNP